MIDHREGLKADMLRCMIDAGHARDREQIEAVIDFLFDNGFWRTFALLLIISALKFDQWVRGPEEAGSR